MSAYKGTRVLAADPSPVDVVVTALERADCAVRNSGNRCEANRPAHDVQRPTLSFKRTLQEREPEMTDSEMGRPAVGQRAESETEPGMRSFEFYTCQPPEPLAEAAIFYASCGLPVFPLHHAKGDWCSCGEALWGRHGDLVHSQVGKHPIPRHGFQDATKNPVLVARWWSHFPTANIGVPTGTPIGLLVVDMDPKNGGDQTLCRLQADHPFPPTYTVRTPSGGLHFYFSTLGVDPPLRSSAGRLGLGIDTRGDGGYIVVPPSRTPNGLYSVEDAVMPSPIPSWMVAALQVTTPGKSKRSERTTGEDAGNGRALAVQHYSPPPPVDIEGLVLQMLRAPQGQRNVTLNRLAFWIGLHSSRVNFSVMDAVCRLRAAAGITGLNANEIHRTIGSGYSAGCEEAGSC